MKFIEEFTYANQRKVGVRFAEKPDPPQDIIELYFDDTVIALTPREFCDLGNIIRKVQEKFFIQFFELAF